MRVLVTAASKYGATVEIARATGDVLASAGFDIAGILRRRSGRSRSTTW
jgi:hypothetical protein